MMAGPTGIQGRQDRASSRGTATRNGIEKTARKWGGVALLIIASIAFLHLGTSFILYLKSDTETVVAERAQATEWIEFVAPPRGEPPIELRPPRSGWRFETRYKNKTEGQREYIANAIAYRGDVHAVNVVRITSNDARPLKGWIQFRPD